MTYQLNWKHQKHKWQGIPLKNWAKKVLEVAYPIGFNPIVMCGKKHNRSQGEGRIQIRSGR